MNVLFKPGLDSHQIGFAMDDAIAHLNHLAALGHLEMIEDGTRYRRLTGSGQCIMPDFS